MNLKSIIPKTNEIDVAVATAYLTLGITLILTLIYAF